MLLMLLLSTLLSLFTLSGEVTYYAPDLMEKQYRRHLARDHFAACPRPACAGYIALHKPYCRIGDRFALQRPGQPAEGPFLVVDCGTFQTPGRIAEVDYLTAARWRMLGGPLKNVRLRLLAEEVPDGFRTTDPADTGYRCAPAVWRARGLACL